MTTRRATTRLQRHRLQRPVRLARRQVWRMTDAGGHILPRYDTPAGRARLDAACRRLGWCRELLAILDTSCP